MRLVDVPMRVRQPPRMATIDSGIISFLTGTPVAADSRNMIGIRITTTGVLFMNTEAINAPPITSRIASRGCLLARATMAQATADRPGVCEGKSGSVREE